jgi:hypothetical protein
MSGEIVLRKTLTANDLGRTGSHQAGLHVPKAMVDYMPSLNETRQNPDTWLTVSFEKFIWRWRYIHYNNALFGTGTRDEYRLTHTREFLQSTPLLVGQQIELRRTGDASLIVRPVNPRRDEDPLVLMTSGPWRVVRLR